MAKGSSVLAAPTHGEEVAGEYRRFVAQPDRGRVAGTRDADKAAPMGDIAIERYRFQGAQIPTPWSGIPTA